MGPAAPRVAICIATYRRPDGLDRLLEGLSRLRYAGPPPAVRVVVVDNDAAGSATAVVDRWRPAFEDLVLEREDMQGISFARNRCLEAAGEVDFIAFIDDDEVPEPDWLDELLRVQAEYQADVVHGPVLPRFDGQPQPWITEGKFFERPRHQTGTELPVAFTHNVLFRYLPYGRDLRFAPRFARSGGSDTHFFLRARQMGARIVWADSAVVHEWNPQSRQTVRWRLMRQYRIGLTQVAIDADLRINPHPRLRSAREAKQRLWDGVRWLWASRLGPKHQQVRALARMADGVGRLAGLLGFWFEEYRG